LAWITLVGIIGTETIGMEITGGIPITIINEYYNSSRRGSSNSNTADTNRSYNSTSRTFSNDRSSSNSRTFRETGVTLIELKYYRF
jgi:hypothetical protein